MARYLLLHVGFEKPTPDIMEAWQAWFADVADVSVEHAGLMNGCEITSDGTTELAWDAAALTGYSVIDVPDRAAAEKLAAANPFITAVRVYEIRGHG